MGSCSLQYLLHCFKIYSDDFKWSLDDLLLQIQKTCESRVKHLSAATDELTKFETELHKFNKWLEVTEKELDRQTEAVEEFENITRVKEQHKVNISSNIC